MSTMFALVLTVSMLTGGNQDVLLGVYDTENDCKAAAEEQHVKAECYPLKGVLDEHPAGFTVQMEGEECRRNAVTAVKQSRENQW